MDLNNLTIPSKPCDFSLSNHPWVLLRIWKNYMCAEKIQNEPLFQHESTFGQKRIYLCKHLKEMERIWGKWMRLVIPSGRRTAAVKYSVLTLDVGSSIVFNCCWLIHSDSENSLTPLKTKVGTRTCLIANSLYISAVGRWGLSADPLSQK